MKPIEFTDDVTGAVYSVRALTIGEEQNIINITIDLLKLVAKKRGWEIPEEQDHYSGSYPYSVYKAAREYIALWQATEITGTPSHPYPDSLLDLLGVPLFEGWLKFLRQRPDFKNKWATAWNKVNGEDADPQPLSDDVTPEPAS
ncbi:MAG: hypothetical protein ACPG7F_00920 [Aggregatilineales bacterium]